jgi:hypothetical protein
LHLDVERFADALEGIVRSWGGAREG